MTSRNFHKLFGAPPRESEKELTQFHMDLAASIQVVTEEVVLKIQNDKIHLLVDMQGHSAKNRLPIFFYKYKFYFNQIEI